MNRTLKFIIMKKSIALLVLLTLSISCSKDDTENPNQNEVDTILVSATGETSFADDADILYGLDLAMNNDSYSSKSNNSNCPSVTVDNSTPGSFPKTFTVDFGSGCNYAGFFRSGTLMVTLSDYILNTNSVLTIERGSNYFINGRQFEGTVVYTNTTQSGQNFTWTREINNGVITTLNGLVISYTDNRVNELTEGGSTLILTDNVYTILSGTRVVTRSNGTNLTAEISSPLVKPYVCSNVTQGILNLNGTFLDGSLNYGDGTCDNQAIYTHNNGVEYPITLP